MEYRSLGRTGVQVSALSLGTMLFGSSTDEHEAAALVERALDHGINSIDTANIYGRSEEIHGQVLAHTGKRQRLVLAYQGDVMIPEAYLDLLTSTALAHIATIGGHGEPQSTPVWFGWDGTYIRFSQTKRQQKYRNLLRDSRVALSIVDLHNPYRYLEVRGTVVAFEDDPDRSFVDAMARKYLGVDRYPWHRAGDEHVAIVILPQHTSQMG